MEGKTCLITGGSDGIGYVRRPRTGPHGGAGGHRGPQRRQDRRLPWSALSPRPATPPWSGCWPTCRRSGRCASVAAEALERLPRLDVLLNNAGAIFLSNRRSVDGLEMTFALNHIGYFLLTTLLLEQASGIRPGPDNQRVLQLPRLAGKVPAGRPSRSREANRGYRAYGRSKLCNILFTYELARRLEVRRTSASTPCIPDWCRPTSPATTGCWAARSTSSSALAEWTPTRVRRRCSTWLRIVRSGGA